MQPAVHEFEQLIREYHALMGQYGRAQTRCSEQLRAQAAEIARLRAEAMRLRAAVIIRETALAWAKADRNALERSIPGLPRRITLARRVDALLGRIQDLVRERRHWQRHAARPRAAEDPQPEERPTDLDGLEAGLQAADLVICQVGCLSHGAYWRVQDHCRRMNKACVLVERPDAVRIMRIATTDGEEQGRAATHKGRSEA